MDEIGNLSYEVQVQLLRALQERRIRRIGSTKEIEVDVRLISATNENLKEAIAKATSGKIYTTVSMSLHYRCLP